MEHQISTALNARYMANLEDYNEVTNQHRIEHAWGAVP